MSLLDHTPSTSPADAERIAAEVYGLQVQASAMPSERDKTFRLNAADGAAYVMKVSNALDTLDLLEAQTQAAELAHAAGVPVQQLRRALTGEKIPTVDGHFVRVLDFIPGLLLGDVTAKTAALRNDLGRQVGQLARSLSNYDHPAAHREFYWDVAQAGSVLTAGRSYITDPDRLSLLDGIIDRWSASIEPRMKRLRHAVIHGDANDNNVVVEPGDPNDPSTRYVRIAGILDFGDLVYSAVINDVAVAASYHVHDADDPVGVVADIARGFDQEYPLEEAEIELLWDLVTMRLSMSAVNAAVQSTQRPGDAYLTIDEESSWVALTRIAGIHPRRAMYRLRDAIGLEPHPHGAHIRNYLARQSPAPMLGSPWADYSVFHLDLSVGSDLFAADEVGMAPAAFDVRIRRAVNGDMNTVAVGGYGESRLVYTAPEFATSDDPADERRTVHLAVDVWTHAEVPLHAPIPGRIHRVNDNTAHLDYGPVVIVEHTTDDGVPFYSLYGHLSTRTLERIHEGDEVAAGDVIGWIGTPPRNGDWAPHVHVQLIMDLFDLDVDYPGVGVPSQRSFWLGLSPDPALLLGLPSELTAAARRELTDTLDDRRRLLGPNLSISYRKPLRIVRGIGSYLFDDDGRSYLDSVNNVAHVGHAHPHVVAAGQRQMAVLNTNTRYLHENVIEYASRLGALLPDPLSVCFFVNSGSEANDLALRLIRAHTGNQDVICVEHGYHGHTQALIDVSPYKHAGKGGRGAPDWVHTAAMPDPYRGAHRGYGPEIGQAYAADVARCVSLASERGLAGMIVESMIGCGGQVVLPDGYLTAAAAHVRAAGGLVIADEVQVGFGRVGPKFWGFATQGLVPDIVTMGKPAGNGHPLAAVVTTPEIAASFANGMEYFNTFGGNPVSAAIGCAVLDVIEDDGLAANAERIGERILRGARELADRYEIIGDARGLGLYLGIELVRDRQTLEPADAEASYIIEQMRDLGVLVSIDGPYNNVLKIKPPIVWGEVEADRLISTLDRVLADPALRR
jgi:4-aminobutyrate aminotransferase-like enzyme/Ser/Thr protein kinase RdoA (MazF antagonist)